MLGYLAPKEAQHRKKEQAELTQRQMKQTVIVGGIEVDGETVSVEADRLISVREIRSAFRFPLTLKISTVSRTAANPYGLRLEEVSPIKPDEVKK